MVSRRSCIFLGILAIYAAGIAFLLYRVVIDIDPRYRESAEESLVETSQLLASLVEQDVIACERWSRTVCTRRRGSVFSLTVFRSTAC